MLLVASAAQGLFDAHNHLQLPHSSYALAELVTRSLHAGVSECAVCSTSRADWPLVRTIKAAHPEFVHAQYGIHPWWVTERDAQEPSEWGAELRQLLLEDPNSGLGETGLDKSRRSAASLAAQKDVCLAHLRIARDLQRPVTLHCVRAYGSLLEVLEAFSRSECRQDATEFPTCILHSFRGPPDLIQRFERLGCYFSFSGHPLDARHLDLIRLVPRARLLLETDAPDQCPSALVRQWPGVCQTIETAAATGEDGSSGSTLRANEPAVLRAIVAYVASALCEQEDELGRLVSSNARRAYSTTTVDALS